jgi:gliding motility-associated-like protein
LQEIIFDLYFDFKNSQFFIRMKKHLILHLILCCTAFCLYAQTPFQKSLPVYLDSALIRSAPDGQSVYVVGMTKANSTTRLAIMQLSSSGNLLWQREYIGNGTTIIKSIETVSNGVLVLIGDNPDATHANGFLMKFKTDGAIAWSRQLGIKNFTNVLEIKKDGSDNIWLSGEHLPTTQTDSVYSFLIQFNSTGSMLYNRKNMHHYFSNNPNEVYKVTDLIWNPNISALLMVEDFEAPYAYSYISGPSRGRYGIGSYSNGQSAEWLMDFQFSKLVNTKVNIAASGWTMSVTDLKRDKPAICLLNKSGQNFTHTKITSTILRPIHSQSGDILFYDPIDQTLTKYDTSLTAIWRKKYDNCYETKAFTAEGAIDGSIYALRNIDNKTIINHILPSGSLSVCADYNKTSVPIADIINDNIAGNYPLYGLQSLSFQTMDSLLTTNLMTATPLDYCFKLDAAFDLPDTICLGTTLKPDNVDTTTGLRHDWFILAQWTQTVQPTINFPSTGRYKVYHSVQNLFCTDTISRYVTVIAAPKTTLTDTVVCGSAKLAVNLTDKDALHYFLNGTVTPPIFDITLSGTYTLRLENQSCKAEKSIKVKLVDFPKPLKPVDSMYCQGVLVPVILTGRFEQIYWDNKPVQDTFIIRDALKHSYQATYSLDKDCIVKGEFSVLRKNCGGSTIPDIIFVPNVFSPNSDGANDVFQAFPTRDAEILSLMIYNRWGNLVFQSSDGQKAWDGLVNGKAVPPDVYIYAIQYRNKLTNKVQVLSGDVTILK